MDKIYIGTSGYNYRDWKGKFYPVDLPQKEWLSYYSRHFNTLEINATFYRSFPKSVFENWHYKTPADFYFAIKGSRFITHIRKLNNVSAEVKTFFEAVSALKEKLAVVLWQFPASFRFNDDNFLRLGEFLLLLPKAVRQAIELRHNSWFNQETYNLLNRYKAGFVINDTPVFDSQEAATSDFVYIRFHGPQALYASSYSGSKLLSWAKKIKEYAKEYTVFGYFNNDVAGYAVDNANELMEILKKFQ